MERCGVVYEPHEAERDSGEENAIRALLREAEATQNDVERFLALHTKDTVIVNIAGIRLLGRDALRAAMSKALQSSLANVITRTEVLDIRFARPGIAIVSCVKHVSDMNPDAGSLPLRGSLTYVVIKQEEGWKIALAQTTPAEGQ